MLKVGLTGSIAVGKSYVCEVLRELGAHVLDADSTAREVVEPNTPGLRRIVASFGPEILAADGTLDRVKMASIVFNDADRRAQLNAIVHPLVFEAQSEWLAAREAEDPRGIAVIDAALMIESGSHQRFTKLIAVWCDPAIQLERLMLRNNLSETEALRRIGAQMPQEEKKRYADFLIDSSEGFAETRRQTAEVFERLKLYI
jgi:dephospho-CoA kinase